MSSVVQDRIAGLKQGLADLGDILLRFDSDPHVLFLTDASSMSGATRDAALSAAEAFRDLWPGWSRVQEAIELAEERLATKDVDGAVAALWIDGEGAEAVLTELHREAREVQDTASRFAHLWDDVIPRRDALRGRLGTLEERAVLVEKHEAPELRAARGAVEALAKAVEDDPIGADPAIAEQAVEAAERLVRDALEERDGLAGRLAAAATLVSRLPDLIARGALALDTAREKIVDGGALLSPVDRTVVDGDDPQALAPWLRRIEAAHDRGEWQAARAGLEAWERVADAVARNAERVLAANEAPIRYRDELRGLLTALRAKAAATGFAEDPDATAAYEAARDILWVAPCPLALGERRVLAYRDLINAGGTT